MLGGILLILFFALISQGVFRSFEKKHRWFSKSLMNKLFWYHIFFIGVYYTYAVYNPSDSKNYFARPQNPALTWGDSFGTSTTFIDFISYPFINGLGFSYEMMMVLYGYLGFIGFLYAYLFFRENIPIQVKVLNRIDLLTLILFLPNMHFWTASMGKGAPIFMGLMMFSYAIKNPKDRIFTLIFASIVIYFIRPHVFLFVAAGTVLGYMSGREKISLWKKTLIYIGMIGALFIVQDTILGMAGLENSDNLVTDFENFSEDRAGELSKSGSGVNMTSYPLTIKLITFWFRPLFFDAPGLLGLIVSMENLVYLLLFFKIVRKGFIKFLRKSPISVKMSLTVFLMSSIAMSFVMSNLGIMMRQKSMVMYFLFFVIYYFLAEKKYKKIMKMRKKKVTFKNQQKLKSEVT